MYPIRLALFATAACALLATGVAESQESETTVTIQGTVYEDRNQNGTREPDEPGLPAIQVSDGDRILRTGPDGSYRIETTNAIPNTVFVINPSGLRTTSPFFHRVSNADTGVDFGLVTDPAQKGPFSFYHTADFQFDGPRKYAEQIARDLADMEAWAEAEDIRFYTVCGDITTHGEVDDLAFFNEQFDQLARPVYRVFGGHDALAEMPRPKMGNWVDAFGPYTYAWNYGGVHFIALVSEGYLSEEERARQTRFWQQDMAMLPPQTPIVLLAHTPDQINDEIGNAIRNHNILAYLFGHWHTHHTYEVDGVSFFTSGPMRPTDWGGFTKRTRVLRFAGGALTSTSRVLEQTKRLNVLAPSGRVAAGPLSVRVHAYDTKAVPNAVEATLVDNQGAVVSTVALVRENESAWTGVVEPGMPPGHYRVQVRAGEDWDNGEGDAFEVVSSLPQATTGTNWPDVFGGGTRAFALAPSDSPTIHLQWTATLPNAQPHLTSPLLIDGNVYIGIADLQAGARNAGVTCIDDQSGNTRWTTSLPRSINAALASDNDRIFAVDGQGGLYALDRTNGELLWQADAYAGTPFHEDRRYHWRTFLAPATVSNGRVFVAGSYVLAAFDAATGTPLWTNYNDLSRSAYPLSGLAPAGRHVYFENESNVVALAQETGAIHWNHPLASLAGGVSRERGTATPLATDEAVYFHHRSRLRKLDPATGEEIWHAPSGGSLNYMGTPARANGAVVIASGGSILCFDDATGERKWAFGTRTAANTALGTYQDLRNGAAPLILGDYVIVGGDDGYIYVLSLADGTKLGEYNTGTPIKASPAAAGNLVVVTNFAGNVFAFTLAGNED